MFCEDCGAAMPDKVKFCPACGAPRPAAKPPQNNQAYQPQPPIQQQQQQFQQPANPPQPMYAPPPQTPPAKKKISGALVALLVALPVLVVAAGGFLVYWFAIRTSPDAPQAPKIDAKYANGELPDVAYAYQSKKPEPTIEFSTVDELFPSNYRSLESLATFTGYCDYGEMDVLIEVEVPGFTQTYRQKVTLGRQVTKIRIVPPLITGTIDLNTEKTAQLAYSVTDADTGKLIVQESKNIKMYSRYDIVFHGETAHAYTDNFLAWLTIEAPEIVELKRDAIDYLSYITNGELQMLIGYQDIGLFGGDVYSNTWVQAVAIQGAVSDMAKVRYNNSWFSMDAQQRVLLPADVIRTKSGICVETSLLVASALQSMGMHCMLIFPPGHTQVALEAWPSSGDYFLIETTVLPMDANSETWSRTVEYLTKEQWMDYISGEGYYTNTMGPCYVLDCDLAIKLGIRSMTN